MALSGCLDLILALHVLHDLSDVVPVTEGITEFKVQYARYSASGCHGNSSLQDTTDPPFVRKRRISMVTYHCGEP